MQVKFSTDLDEIALMPPVPRLIHLILLEFILESQKEPPRYDKLYLDSSDSFSNPSSNNTASLKMIKENHGKVVEELPPPEHLGKSLVQAILNRFFEKPHPDEQNAQAIDFELTDGTTVQLRMMHHPRGKILIERLPIQDSDS